MIELTDPTRRADFYDKLDPMLKPLVKDPRDLPFVVLTFTALLVLVPFAVFMFASPGFSPWFAVAYLGILFLGFIDKYTLMLHCTSHRRLFAKHVDWMNHLIPAVLGPFMGQTPYTYFAHHIGMHHHENNLAEDLSSTLSYRRDSLRGFLHYFGRFFFFGIFELTRYQARRGRWKLFRMALVGELGWVLGVVLLAWLNFWATFTVFIVPFVMIRFLMMAGNWAQHAFVDAAAPENPYKNSLTCINSRYNRRAYNDGYHAGHHVKANRHWTEMPDDFRNNLARYRDEDAIVFTGLDYFQIWALLMAKRYKTLARHFVDLREVKRSEDEVVALLKERTSWSARGQSVASPGAAQPSAAR
ncbi:MAG TPA: fatty acid desaturase [Myxococcota bacterium]|nr:fatty acid desaturase [Myxococcota bacterium]